MSNPRNNADRLLPSSDKDDAPMVVGVIIFAILTMVVVVFKPALSNSFNGDDFVHLNWLRQAVENPELVWRNFHSAWLDIPTARFYRPLISIFMLGDYVLYQRSGIGFHITNLICHMANTVLLYLLLAAIFAERQNLAVKDVFNGKLWALAAAALFAFYPLHTEAVCWITGRVDAVVTMFFLASLWCYIRWRQSAALKAWLFASCLTFVLALLSKEMAVILPALLVCYELLIGKLSYDESGPAALQNEKIKICLAALRITMLFWLLLAFYFLLRVLSLGTLVGGYDNSLLPTVNRLVFLKNWWHSFCLTLLPFNKNLFLQHSWLRGVWAICLFVSAVLFIKVFAAPKNEVRKVMFLGCWLVLSLVPVVKLFNITDDMQGSRLAYLASAPLCALLTFGVCGAWVSQSKIMNFTKTTVLSAMLISAWLALSVNIGAWMKAGRESSAIMRSLNKIYAETPGDPLTFLVGLPDNIDGAYVCRNALEGMIRKPQMSRDLKQCFMLNNFDRVFPFGIARASMQSPNSMARIFLWSHKKLSFVPESLTASTSDQNKIVSWTSAELNGIIDVKTKQLNKTGQKASTELGLNLAGRPCFPIELVKVTFQPISQLSENDRRTASLLYTNDLIKEFDPAYRIDDQLVGGPDEQSIAFPLHGEVAWSMGGACHKLQFVLPSLAQIKSVSIESPWSLMPKLSLASASNQYSLGFVGLSAQEPNCRLNYDARLIPNAASVVLEVTHPNTFFELHNPRAADPGASIVHSFPVHSGSIAISSNDFPANGIYQARVRAIDKSGKQIGFASDYVVITVSH